MPARHLIPKFVFASVLLTNLWGCSRPVTPAKPVASKVATTPSPAVSVAAPKPAGVVEQTPSATVTRATELCRLIARRLDLMPGVAQAKWNRKLPITDEQRERDSLAKVVAQGAMFDLPADIVTEFFQAQITAAKQVQEAAFHEWTVEQHPAFENPPSLERDIRPQIDEINGLMLKALAECRAARSANDWQMAVQTATSSVFAETKWSQQTVETATEPLKTLK